VGAVERAHVDRAGARCDDVEDVVGDGQESGVKVLRRLVRS